jgi:hypothetical protein
MTGRHRTQQVNEYLFDGFTDLPAVFARIPLERFYALQALSVGVNKLENRVEGEKQLHLFASVFRFILLCGDLLELFRLLLDLGALDRIDWDRWRTVRGSSPVTTTLPGPPLRVEHG